MESTVSFRLFGKNGWVNPIPARFDLCFWDASAYQFYRKQSPSFDGGWRWFQSSIESDALAIYNIHLHRQAVVYLPRTDLVDCKISAEFLLLYAKSWVVLEHNYFNIREAVLDGIQAMVTRARREVLSNAQLR